MKKIKFRAWNKVRKQMNPVSALKFDKQKYNLMFIDAGWHHIPENFELMQFTGLKDINGKEIYEGDIVKGEKVTMSCGDEDDDYERKRTYDIGVFAWQDKEPMGGWYLNYPKMKNCQIKLYLSTIKVIGNIYENPELIE